MTEPPLPTIPRMLTLVKDDPVVGDDLVMDGRLLEPLVADPARLPELNDKQLREFRMLCVSDKHAIRVAMASMRMLLNAALVAEDQGLAEDLFALSRRTREKIIEPTLGSSS